MLLYRIADWLAHFENNRTKDMKIMRWTPVPNKLDGDGYTELLDHPNGAAHYGVWMAIVCIASRCETRGTLLRSTCEPHTSTSLSRISRIPKELFDEAIPRLVSIGWLSSEPYKSQALAGTCGKPAGIPQASAMEGKGRERKGRKGTEEKGREGTEEKETSVEFGNSTVVSVGEVIEHYQQYHPRSKPGDKEKSKIHARLKDGYSVDDLKAAIDGCHRSPFHCGENEGGKKYQSLELIVRDASHVATFLETPINGEEPVLSEKTRRTMRAVAVFVDQEESKNEQD